jgi:hypothetical protein
MAFFQMHESHLELHIPLLFTIDYYTSLNNHSSMARVTKDAKASKPSKTKVKKVAKATAPSTTSSSSSAVPATLFECSPPAQKNGASCDKLPILSKSEMKLYNKHKIEVKQMAALVILKCGLGIAEGPTIGQIHQEENFFNNFPKVYEALCRDPIIGNRISLVPLKFLNIGKSTSVEIQTGLKLRKKYSELKAYMNNTLTAIWRK